MAFDIAISDKGDLVFSAAKDLLYVDGKALLEQRMMVRLLMARGAWMLDADSDLGSDLRYLVGHDPVEVVNDAENAAKAALFPMSDEITIQDIVVTQTSDNELTLVVNYSPVVPDVPPGFRVDTSAVLLQIPLGGVG